MKIMWMENKTYESPTVSMSLGNDNSNNITPINNKNNVAKTITNFEESPQITYFAFGWCDKFTRFSK